MLAVLCQRLAQPAPTGKGPVMDSAPSVSDAEVAEARRIRRAELQRHRRQRQRLAGDPAIQRYKDATAEAKRRKRQAESEEDRRRRLAADAEYRRRKRRADSAIRQAEAKSQKREDPGVRSAEDKARLAICQEDAALRQARLGQTAGHETANNPFRHVCSVCDSLWHRKELTPLPEDKQCVLQCAFKDSDLTTFMLCRTCLHSVKANNIPHYFNTNSYVYPSKPQHLPPLNTFKDAAVAIDSSCSLEKSNIPSTTAGAPSAPDGIATQKDSAKLCKKHATIANTSTSTSTFSLVSNMSIQTEAADNGTQTAGILYAKGTQTQFPHRIFTDAQSAFMFYGPPHYIRTNAAAQVHYSKVKNSLVGAEEFSRSLQRPHIPKAAFAFDSITTYKEKPDPCKNHSIANGSIGASTCPSMSSMSTQTEVREKGTQTAGILYGKGMQT